MSLRPLSFGLVLLISGCFEPPSLDGAPCPCTSGYVCCPTTGLCITADDDTCSGGGGMTVTTVEPQSGPTDGGTTITVLGSGFSDDVMIRLGGSDCGAVSVLNPGRLTCVTSPGRQDGAVDVVATSELASAVLPGAFRYTPYPWSVAYEAETPLDGPTFGALSILDLDSDGVDDVLFGASLASGRPRVWLSDGHAGVLREAEPDLSAQSGTAVGDIDNDGANDLFVSTTNNDAPSVLIGVPDEPWFVRDELSHDAFDFGGLRTNGPALADFDGDGDLDAVVCLGSILADQDPSRTVVYLENDGGRLREAPERMDIAVERLPADAVCHATTTGDFSGDGRPDVVACGRGVLLLQNDGGRLVDVSDQLPGVVRADGVTCGSPTLVDVDRDGRLDLAFVGDPGILGRASIGLTIFRNTGAGFELQSGLQAAWPSEETCPSVGRLSPGAQLPIGQGVGLWADFDVDGDADVLLTAPFWTPECSAAPQILLNGAAGGEPTLSPQRALAGAERLGATGALGATDLDADGDLDVVQHCGAYGCVRRILRNNAVDNGATGRLVHLRAWTNRTGEVSAEGDAVRRLDVGASVLVDLDGPDGEPDFVSGPSRLVAVTHGGRASSAQLAGGAWITVPPGVARVWARVTFSDGSQAEVSLDGSERVVDVLDCAGARC